MNWLLMAGYSLGAVVTFVAVARYDAAQRCKDDRWGPLNAFTFAVLWPLSGGVAIAAWAIGGFYRALAGRESE